MLSNILLEWENIDAIRGYQCVQYPKLKIILKGEKEQQVRYWGLFLGEKLLKKINISWAADFEDSQQGFFEMKELAQQWWNTDYRTTRFNIKLKLWTLHTKIKQSKGEDAEKDYKYIHSIFIRLLMNHGGLTPNEITGLNALAEKYSIVEIPKAHVIYVNDNEYKVDKYTLKESEDSKWTVSYDDNSYSTENLDDAFIYVSCKIAGVE